MFEKVKCVVNYLILFRIYWMEIIHGFYSIGY